MKPKSTSLMRLKKNSFLRDMCDTISFAQSHLIQPLFIVESVADKEAILGLNGNFRLSEEAALKQIESDIEAGVKQFLLFYVPLKQTAGRFNTDYSTKAMQKICSNFSGAANFWVDTCLCSSLDTGHCCVHHPSGKIDLESSLTLLSKMALELAQAGADGVAPSDMMDGRVAQMREGLDRAGLTDTPIMSYSTKFASGMYGPFRGAADSSPQTGDRKTYQLDVRDSVSALEASRRCATEGADFLMVKPGMTSLDLIPQIKAETGKHVGAYQVSGEYASLLALEEKGFGDFSTLLLETWCVFRRAGSSFIITYGARDAKTILEKL